MILQYSPFKIQPHPETIEAKQVRKIQKQPYKILDVIKLKKKKLRLFKFLKI